MRVNLLKFLVFSVLCAVAAAAMAGALLDHNYRPLAGKTPVNLNRKYAGDVLLVVNTASKCGFTPQYEGLEALHQKYAGRGFAVLGFPSNDFQGQEPGSERQIQEALGTLLADRTAIIIAHRLSTVAIADRVLVMEHGRIIEDDTPDALIAGTGKFAQLHRAWRESLV